IRYGDYEDTGYDELAEAPCLDSVRHFQLGAFGASQVIARGLVPVLERMPRLEELRLHAHGVDTDAVFALPMYNLRTLVVHNLTHYPLHVLAENATLGNLEHLELWPHALEMGDEPYIKAD